MNVSTKVKHKVISILNISVQRVMLPLGPSVNNQLK